MRVPSPVLGPLLGVLLGQCRVGTLAVPKHSTRAILPTCCALEPEVLPDDMTLGEMAQQLAQVRAYYREQGEVEQQDVCRNMMASRIDALRLNRCRVDSSDLHGNGLFATRAIAEGELITFYPGDAVILWLGGQRSEAGVPDATGVVFGAHVPDDERDAIAALERTDYEISATSTISLVGDPKRASDAGYLGHFANDAVTCASPYLREEYEAQSLARSNARHVTVEGCHYATLATRTIASGEEVLVSYGADYWLGRGQIADAAPTVALVDDAEQILARGRAGPSTTRARRRQTESVPAKKKASKKAATSKKAGGGGGGFGR